MKTLFSLKLAATLLVAAASGLSTSTALAAPEILPSEAFGRSFTAKSDGTTNPKFETEKGTAVECERSPGEGTEAANGKPEGSFHERYEGCKGKSGVATVTCTGLGEAAGVVLVLGTWRLWYDSLSPLGVATILLIEEVHFACPFLIPLLFKAKGSNVCLSLEATVHSTIHLGHCTQTGGKADENKYWNEAGEERTAALVMTENDSTNVGFGELGLGEVVSSKEVWADNV